jgi:hypothetical protein
VTRAGWIIAVWLRTLTPASDVDLLVVEPEPQDTGKTSVLIGDAWRGLGFLPDVVVPVAGHRREAWVSTVSRRERDT